MEVTGLASVLATLQLVVTAVFTVAGNAVTFIMAEGHEIILIPVGVLLAYTGISAFKRII